MSILRIFTFLYLFLSFNLASAAQISIDTYGEVGKKSTAEDYLEEDEDTEYSYHRAHIGLYHKISDIHRYEISASHYDTDYQSKDNLDHQAQIYKVKWTLIPNRTQYFNFKTDIKFKYKQKRFDFSPRSEYDQTKLEPSFTLTTEKNDSLRFAGGIDHFEYKKAAERDQLKVFGSVKGKKSINNDTGAIHSSYQIKYTEKRNKDRRRNNQEWMGGFDQKFDFNLLSKITTRINWAQRDTKESEERAEDFDFEYWRSFIKTDHKIFPFLSTSLSYQYFKKNYLIANLDHIGYFIRNRWKYDFLNDKDQRFWINFLLEHKQVNYSILIGNNYRKETFKFTANYKRKKNWKTSASLESNFYQFNIAQNNKNRYFFLLSGEKKILGNDLTLKADLKYKLTNHKRREDVEHTSVRLSIQYSL